MIHPITMSRLAEILRMTNHPVAIYILYNFNTISNFKLIIG